MIEDKLYECLICRTMHTRRSLPNHIHSKHHLTAKNYYDKYIEPNTKHMCTCGKPTKFRNMFEGYSQHCSTKCSSLDPIVKSKVIATTQEKYGVDHNLQRAEIREKTCNYETRQKAIIKAKQTWNDKYGMHPMQTAECKNKAKNTNKNKYGVDWVGQNPIIKRKILKNANRLLFEQECYKFLCSKFNQVERHYKSKDYPFECDLYIKDIDLYIELHLFFIHGKHPFDIHNVEDQNLLEALKEKAKTLPLYASYIKTWTITDPYKRQIAKNNNLNYITFYTKQDFYNYFNKEGN